MNFDRPRITIGGGKTVDTTHEVINVFNKYIPPQQKALILGTVISDFAKELERDPAGTIRRFYERLYSSNADIPFVRVEVTFLEQCLRALCDDCDPAERALAKALLREIIQCKSKT